MKKSFWNRFAFLYDISEIKDRGVDRPAEYIAGFLSRDWTLLETACGTGRFSCSLSPSVREVISCDYAENMVLQAQKKARRLGLANLSFSVQDMMGLEFENHRFDAALAANVLHLLPDPQAALGELTRVVKPGGLLIVPNYVNAENSRGARLFLSLMGRFGFRPAREWSSGQFLDFLKGLGLPLLAYQTFPSKRPMCVAVLSVPAEV